MNKTIISIGLLSGLMFFSSCKKDDDNNQPNNLSAAESKTTLDQTANSLKVDLTSMVENESMDAFDSFSDIMGNLDGNETSTARTGKKSYKQYVQSLKDALKNASNASNARMAADVDFETTKGIYEWSENLDDFKKTGTSDKLILKFPSQENDTINNATLTFNSYSEDANENPTKIDMNLVENSTTILSIDFTATYDAESEPTTFDGVVKMSPYTFSADLKKTGTAVSFNTKIESSTITIPIASTSFNGTFTDVSYEDPIKINGSAQLYEITIVGDINAQEIKKANDADGTEEVEKIINENADVYFKKTSTNQKIGDVSVDLIDVANDEDEDVKLYVTYTDGSKADLEVVFESVIDEIEKAVDEVDDEN